MPNKLQSWVFPQLKCGGGLGFSRLKDMLPVYLAPTCCFEFLSTAVLYSFPFHQLLFKQNNAFSKYFQRRPVPHDALLYPVWIGYVTDPSAFVTLNIAVENM